MGNKMGKVEGSQIGAGVGAGKVEEASPMVKQISAPPEKLLAVTAEQLKALQDASLVLGLMKLQEASDFFTASARFAAARQISYLPEPDQMLHFHASKVARIGRGVYWGTPAQRRALERATRKHLQLDTRHVDTRAMEVYQELKRTHVLGDKLLSPFEVASVLKAEASVSGLHPRDLNNLKRLKIVTDNIINVAAVYTAAGLTKDAGTWTWRHWNTRFPISELPEDFFW